MYIKDKWRLEDILTIQYLHSIDLKTIRNIINNFSCLDQVVEERKNQAEAILQDELFTNSIEKARQEARKQIELCYKESIDIVSMWHLTYPQLLKEIPSAPTILYVKGKLQNADSLSISIVGTRKNSHYGTICTEQFAKFFAQNGIIVTSGLAEGIDSIAHKNALKAKGITYAVLGSSLDKIYPMSSEKLFHQIYESGGAVLSEYKLGTITRQPYFIHRNRIISGISKATIVVESKKKGGALITAGFAFDQDREVFAIPGKINSATSVGTNNLIINNQAKLVQSPEQVLQEIGFDFKYSENKEIEKNLQYLDEKELKIYNALSDEPIHIDNISDLTQIDISDVLVKLLNLEFNGFARQLPGKYYIKM